MMQDRPLILHDSDRCDAVGTPQQLDRMVGQADVADSAGRHQLGDRLDADLDGDAWVGIVQLQYIDVFDAEPTKALHEVGLDRMR